MIKNIKELKIGDLLNFGDKAEVVESIKVLNKYGYFVIVNNNHGFRENENIVTW